LDTCPDDPYPGAVILLAQLGSAWYYGLSASAILLLLLGSAAVSGSEAAFFSLTRSRLEELEEEYGAHVMRRVHHLLERPAHLLSTILIANNFINVAIVVVTWFILSGAMAGAAPWVVFLVNVVGITTLLVLFGEILPKVYAARNSVQIAVYMAGPLLLLRSVLKPLNAVLVSSTGFMERRLQRRLEQQSLSLEQYENAIDIAVDAQTSEQEVRILKGILKFGKITVKQIMTSHVDMTAIEEGVSFHDLLQVVRESGYSRIPVYREDKDNIVGIFYGKDLLAYMDEPETFNWHTKVRDAYYVPETKMIDDLLEEFQEKRIHMAIVVDEYGGTSGLVTLEDIMEEVIGEIEDEFDEQEIDHQRLDQHTVIFEGKVLLGDVCKVLDLRADTFDSVRGESDTLAGLLLELAGHIPEAQQELVFDRFRFTVLGVARNRIEKVKVQIEPQNETHADTAA
jgi:putative hemolysin